MGIFISSFPGVTGIGTHCKWTLSSISMVWAGTHCFSNEKRVWSRRSIISFHANSKVCIAEIKAWIYCFGASV
jgi:hypothetical protein